MWDQQSKKLHRSRQELLRVTVTVCLGATAIVEWHFRQILRAIGGHVRSSNFQHFEFQTFRSCSGQTKHTTTLTQDTPGLIKNQYFQHRVLQN